MSEKINAKVVPPTRWVLYGADGKYLLGEFDGKTYKPDHKVKKQLWYGRFYAAQTFDSAPNYWGDHRRRVQIGWAQGITFPGMPFNQQMTVPVELHLYPADARHPAHLTALPVEGVEKLHDGKPVYQVTNQPAVLVPKPLTLADNLDTFDMELLIEVDQKAGFSLDLRGTKLVYDPVKKTLTCKDVTAPIVVDDPTRLIYLRVLVDRGSVEVFANRVAMSVAAIPDEKNRKLELIPQGGAVRIFQGWVYRMKSAWEK